MKAVVLLGQNQPLEIRVLEDQQPGPGQVLVALKSAALNHRDVWIQAGRYPGKSDGLVLGSDGAGVVEKIGAGVDKTWSGKEVIINPSLDWGANPLVQAPDYRVLGNPDQGTFAEHIIVPAENICLKPGHLSFVEAAAIPLAGLTAYRALFTRCNLAAGDTVLVTGIGGGVALFALQFAVAKGATVYVTSSSEAKIEKARDLGAAGGFIYSKDTWVGEAKSRAGGFDVTVDGAAGAGFSDLVEVSNPGGRIALYGQTAGKIKGLLPAKLFWRQLSILGTTMGTPDDFSEMVAFCEKEKIRPIIDEVLPLAEADKAFRKMAAGRQFGKIVLQISDPAP